jgi:hypothetical protein
MDVAQFGPRDDLGYRRPPVTAAYDGLRRRGLPEVLLVHSWLAVSESELTDDGERHMSANAKIHRILFAPEADGKRACTLDLVNGYGGYWLKDNHPVTFTIATRPGIGHVGSARRWTD